MTHVFNGGSFLLILIVLHLTPLIEARPEQAVLLNNIRCTSCHYSPVGGGPKNKNGKLFQNRLFQANPLLVQDYFSADVRALYYQPETPSDSKGGMGLMSGSMAGHVALDRAETIRLVVEHNFAGFAAAPYRDTYLLVNFAKLKDDSWFETLLVGRFRLPFGIVNDEHRTYTQIISNTQWFTFQNGLMLSGTPSSKIHYDFGLVNGINSTGQSLGQGQAEQFGGFFNIRYMPTFFWIGFSGRYHETAGTQTSQAWSLYTVASINRLTNNKIPLSVNFEWTQSQGFNSILSQGYVSDPQFARASLLSKAEGLLAQLEYWLTPKLSLIYKYDWLIPDRKFPDDLYERHGMGIRWMIAVSIGLQLRSEMARATHPSEMTKQGTLAQDAHFAILEVKF